MSRKLYKCPVCGGPLRTTLLPKCYSNGEVYANYTVQCFTCNLFGESICDCTDSCIPDFHFDKACTSLNEGALFLKDFILKGGF